MTNPDPSIPEPDLRAVRPETTEDRVPANPDDVLA